MKGLATGYAATLATIMVGLWLTPFTLRFLDRQEYGIFALASDLLMWLGLLDIGITAGLGVQAAQLSGRPDSERLNRLASTAFFTQNLIVLVVLIVGGAIAVGFPHFFPVRQDLQHTTSMLMAVLVLSSAIGFSTKTFSALLVANQQIHIDNLLRLALVVIRTVLTVVFLKKGWGLYSLAVASLAATLITSMMAVWRTYRLLPGLQIRWVLASWDVLKSLGSLGIWFSLGGVAGIVITSLDRVVAAKLISVETVTTLSLTGRVYALFAGLLDQITNTARPMLGQMLGQQKTAEAQRVYRHLFKLSTGIAVIAAFSLWAGNEPFVTRWVGAQNFGGPMLSMALALNLIVPAGSPPNAEPDCRGRHQSRTLGSAGSLHRLDRNYSWNSDCGHTYFNLVSATADSTPVRPFLVQIRKGRRLADSGRWGVSPAGCLGDTGSGESHWWFPGCWSRNWPHRSGGLWALVVDCLG
jgi:O-antigen/teichoic acid export membrane protein